MVGLVEERDRFTPRVLLVTPVGEFWGKIWESSEKRQRLVVEMIDDIWDLIEERLETQGSC